LPSALPSVSVRAQMSAFRSTLPTEDAISLDLVNGSINPFNSFQALSVTPDNAYLERIRL
jgi:hypothetical protein